MNLHCVYLHILITLKCVYTVYMKGFVEFGCKSPQFKAESKSKGEMLSYAFEISMMLHKIHPKMKACRSTWPQKTRWSVRCQNHICI